LQGVLNRDLDAGFYEGETNDSSIELLPLTHLNLVVAVPQAWASELDQPDWRILEQKPWVAVSPLCSHYDFLQRLARDRGFNINPRFSNDDDATALNLVAANMAVCITTTEVLRSVSGLNGRVAIWPHFRHKIPLSLCFLKSRASDPILRELVKAATATWARAEAAA
jgi:DNA-binding transcriptional LysR family regulator